MTTISNQLFSKRGVEYSLLYNDKDIDMDDVVLFKHTPINSKHNHIFFASPRQLLETSYMCPACSGELEIMSDLINYVNRVFDNPRFLDNMLKFKFNDKSVLIDYIGLSCMSNHQIKENELVYIEEKRGQFDYYLLVTYHELRYHVSRVKEEIYKFREDL